MPGWCRKESNEQYVICWNRTNQLSIAFDLPTQIGYDSDDQLADGGVGKWCCYRYSAIWKSFDQIPDKVSTSMTINSPQQYCVCYCSRREAGQLKEMISGTVRNILKEYIAHGTYIFPKPSFLIHIFVIVDKCK
jgi:methylmalonyl-CoA mutase N-terminal domain/subunit